MKNFQTRKEVIEVKNSLFLVLFLTIALTGVANAHDGVPEATSGFRQPMDNLNYNGYHYNEWSSRSGCYHPGADYNKEGTSGDGDLDWDILAVADGKVVDIYNDDALGLCMAIEHTYFDTTVYSQYGHLHTTLVEEGDNVTKGQHIAELGHSGTGAGTNNAHLHWEIRMGGEGENVHPDPENSAYWNKEGYLDGFQSRTNIKNWYANPALWCDNMPSYEIIQGKFAGVVQRNGGSSVVGTAIVRNVNSQGVPASYGELLLRHEINGQVFYTAYYHCSKVYVKNGQSVKKGNRIALIGSIGAGTAVHLHWEVRIYPDHPDEEVVDYWGYSLQNEDENEVPMVETWYRDPESFVAGLDIDFEASQQGSQNIGSKNGSLHWWYDLGSVSDLYNSSDHTPRHCYIQDYSGGTYGNCAIVFDALGGARKAYTVRTGFWNNGGGNGWSQLNPAGLQSSLGMPITDEYENGTGCSRQDFQKGHLY